MQIFNGNYVDLVIIAILIYFASEAFRHGFWVILSDFISFFGSLVLSLRFYGSISEFLKLNFDLNLSMAKAIGFLMAAIIFESILGYLAGYIVHKLPEKFKKHKLNQLLGIFPGVGEGLVLVSAVLILLIALPIKPQIKNDITESKIGNVLLNKTAVFESAINEVFGGVINDSLTYFTVNPDSGKSIPLDVVSFKLSVDEKAESDMFAKINQERKKLAIPELVLLAPLSGVARSHAKDMWERKYFAHVSPEGKNVGDRLQASKVSYSYAGENLALAPTTVTAHNGLMNSKGHRENILDSRFKKVGVGVIDNGVYGKIFVQVFTD